MIMPMNLSGVYVVAVMYMLGASFLFVAAVTGALAITEVVRARGAPLKRVWGLYSLSAVLVGGGCFLFPHAVRLPAGAVKWLEDGHTWLLVPGPLLLWWILARALRWSYARRVAEEAATRRGND